MQIQLVVPIVLILTLALSQASSGIWDCVLYLHGVQQELGSIMT